MLDNFRYLGLYLSLNRFTVISDQDHLLILCHDTLKHKVLPATLVLRCNVKHVVSAHLNTAMPEVR